MADAATCRVLAWYAPMEGVENTCQQRIGARTASLTCCLAQRAVAMEEVQSAGGVIEDAGGPWLTQAALLQRFTSGISCVYAHMRMCITYTCDITASTISSGLACILFRQLCTVDGHICTHA